MWHQYVSNPKAITHLYQEVPALREMVVTLCQLDPRGPSVRIEMDFPRFADHRPQRWNPLWNTVALQLDFWGIEDLKLEGFSTHPVWDFSIEKTAADLLVRAGDESTRLSFRCRSVLPPERSDEPQTNWLRAHGVAMA